MVLLYKEQLQITFVVVMKYKHFRRSSGGQYKETHDSKICLTDCPRTEIIVSTPVAFIAQ